MPPLFQLVYNRTAFSRLMEENMNDKIGSEHELQNKYKRSLRFVALNRSLLHDLKLHCKALHISEDGVHLIFLRIDIFRKTFSIIIPYDYFIKSHKPFGPGH